MTLEEKEQWDIFMKIWVIPALKNTWNEKKCKEIVEALEEWEKQEPWIPVSEELPEGLMIKTLVSCENDYGLPVCPMIAVYDGFKQKWDCDYRVIAWMPLPAPYEPQERNEKE